MDAITAMRRIKQSVEAMQGCQCLVSLCVSQQRPNESTMAKGTPYYRVQFMHESRPDLIGQILVPKEAVDDALDFEDGNSIARIIFEQFNRERHTHPENQEAICAAFGLAS